MWMPALSQAAILLWPAFLMILSVIIGIRVVRSTLTAFLKLCLLCGCAWLLLSSIAVYGYFIDYLGHPFFGR